MRHTRAIILWIEHSHSNFIFFVWTFFHTLKNVFYILFLLLLLLSLFCYILAFLRDTMTWKNEFFNNFLRCVREGRIWMRDGFNIRIMALLLGIYIDMWLWNMPWDVIGLFFEEFVGSFYLHFVVIKCYWNLIFFIFCQKSWVRILSRI